MSTDPKLYKGTFILIGLALLNILIHLLCYNNLEYHRDELLYFTLGLHPALGYATVPPLIGWVAFVMQSLFGFTLFSVKLFPALLSGVFLYVTAGITRELGGKLPAQILTAIAILVMPLNLRAFYLFQPVCIDLFLWTYLLYLVIRYINTSQDKYLLIFGVVLGFAFLNKYLIALLLITLLLALASTGHFDIFRKRKFYYAAGLTLLIFLPNLIWQVMNGLPVIDHMRELNENQLVNVDRVQFLIDQLMSPFAASLLTIPGLLFLLFNKKYRFVGVTAALVILILCLLRGKSYYTVGVIPALIAAGGVFFEKYVRNKLAFWSLPILMILITVPVIPFGIPVYKAERLVKYFHTLEVKYGLILGRTFEDGSIHSLPQDYADQLGWEELTMLTSRAYDQVTDKDRCLIYCENYGQAGALAVIGKKYGLPEPVSFHESFYYWKPLSFDPDIETLIYINDELGEDVEKLFADITIVGKISNPHAREYGTTVYLCRAPRSSFNALWKDVLKRIEEE
ncbi:MAG TPA: glycosyltransferase family 39 protein [Saprospiraceae bacterium]|nr:glycosyltransferase family 39 protein [Saprospiraceae bacterium]